MKKKVKVLKLSDIQKLYTRKCIRWTVLYLLSIGLLLWLGVGFVTIEFLCMFLIFSFMWFLFCAVDWKYNRKIKNGEFKILETKLFSKHIQGSGEDVVRVLVFEAKARYGRICYNDLLRTIWRFNKLKVNDPCYLLLVANNREGEYECIRVWWKVNTTLAEDLQNYIVAPDDIESKIEH